MAIRGGLGAKSRSQELGGRTGGGAGLGRPLAVRLTAHGVVAGACVLYATVFGRHLVVTEPAVRELGLDVPSPLLVALSLLGGGALGAATLLLSRWIARSRRGIALLEALRSPTEGASDAALFALAIAGGVAEELLFRGVLSQALGVVLSSVLFGLAHQVRGPARWVWAGWALVLGLLLAGLFRSTGSLAGPVLAHCAINFGNLRFLRDARMPRPRRLGGLLAR